MKEVFSTENAPAAIGTYAQAVRHDNTVYVSGQIPLDPASMEIVSDDFEEQAARVFENISAVCSAAGGTLDDVVKFTVYLTDLSDFGTVNEVMARFLSEPYPARAAVQVSALPRGARIEVDAIVALDN